MPTPGRSTEERTTGHDPTEAGFFGWSPESEAESEVYSIAGGAGENDPARITDATTAWTTQRRTRDS